MDYKLFVCVQCGFEYDEEKGWPEDGIAPGTRWDDIPDDWSCPDCGAAKSDFEMVEVARRDRRRVDGAGTERCRGGARQLALVSRL